MRVTFTVARSNLRSGMRARRHTWRSGEPCPGETDMTDNKGLYPDESQELYGGLQMTERHFSILLKKTTLAVGGITLEREKLRDRGTRPSSYYRNALQRGKDLSKGCSEGDRKEKGT